MREPSEGHTALKDGNYELALKEFTKLARRGHAESQHTLGWMFHYGKGTPADQAKAAHWFHKSAEQGIDRSQYNLGNFYARGEGVTQSLTESVKWYRKAAEQRLAQAQHSLGCIYVLGDGVPKNIIESFKWFHRAAMQGIAEAQYIIGLFYMGEWAEVAPDREEAEQWFRKASQSQEEPPELGDMISRRLTSPPEKL